MNTKEMQCCPHEREQGRNILDQIKDFCVQEKFPSSIWVRDETAKIYIRLSKRYLNDEMLNCFDIANIEVFNKGKGIFSKQLLPAIIAMNPCDVIYVECVHNKRFAKYLAKNGWNEQNFGGAPSFYKKKYQIA